MDIESLNSTISFINPTHAKDLNESSNVNLMDIYVEPS
jgi:hypothetical protein